jgi:Acetyltransferase (GNAT) domain
VLSTRVLEAMLAEVSVELGPAQRFRLWSIEAQGRTIGSLVFVGAGGAVSYWLGGFDVGWSAYGPAIELVRAALEHAWSIGDRIVDFGHYKYTFADEEDNVAPVDLVPRSSGYMRARIRLGPEHLRHEIKAARYDAFRHLSPDVEQRLKSLRARMGRGRSSA